MRSIRIGNGAGFWGDSPAAPREILQTGELDYLTLEYLAELTLSILSHQKQKNPQAGFVPDVARVSKHLAECIQQGARTKLVSNGGGMNPAGCAADVALAICEKGLSELKIGVATGDDFASRIGELRSAGVSMENMDTGESFEKIQDRIASANVYLGAAGIVEALDQDATIVLTGRIADASLVTGPCIHEFGWSFSEFDKIAKATVAGHLIECGAQVTGGFYSDWSEEIPLGNVGYPIAIVDENGESRITKPLGSGGVVNEKTCAEQLIYEIGDPEKYGTPDVIADFSMVQFQESAEDEVKVRGGKANGAPDKLKASIAYYDGFMASSMIVVVGPDSVAKARAAGKAVFEKLERDGVVFDETRIEVLGSGDTIPGLALGQGNPWEVVLRLTARSSRREFTDRLGRELAPLVTSGPPGITGYTGSKSRSTPVLSFWPTLIDREHFSTKVEVKAASEWLIT